MRRRLKFGRLKHAKLLTGAVSDAQASVAAANGQHILKSADQPQPPTRPAPPADCVPRKAGAAAPAPRVRRQPAAPHHAADVVGAGTGATGAQRGAEQ